MRKKENKKYVSLYSHLTLTSESLTLSQVPCQFMGVTIPNARLTRWRFVVSHIRFSYSHKRVCIPHYTFLSFRILRSVPYPRHFYKYLILSHNSVSKFREEKKEYVYHDGESFSLYTLWH